MYAVATLINMPKCGQAENAVDRMDWVDKITGVIASLLNNQVPEQVFHFSYGLEQVSPAFLPVMFFGGVQQLNE